MMRLMRKLFMSKRNKKLLALAVLTDLALKRAAGLGRNAHFKNDPVRWSRLGLRRTAASHEYCGVANGKNVFGDTYVVTIGGAGPDCGGLKGFVRKFIHSRTGMWVDVTTEW